MHREILFKAKRKNWRKLPKEQWWVEGYIVKCHTKDCECYGIKDICHVNDGYFDFTPFAVDENTISQYTGLPDKNGKKIWENCIIRDDDGKIGVVKFNQYDIFHIGFFIEWINEKAKYCRSELGYWALKVEVGGNIFDNPELLGIEGNEKE